MAAALQAQETVQSDLTSPGRDSMARVLLQPLSNTLQPYKDLAAGVLTQTIPQPLDQCCCPVPKAQRNMATTGFSQDSTDVPQKQQGQSWRGICRCCPPASPQPLAGLRAPYPHSCPITGCPGHHHPQPPSLLSPLVAGTSYGWRKATEPLRLILRKVFAHFDSQVQC